MANLNLSIREFIYDIKKDLSGSRLSSDNLYSDRQIEYAIITTRSIFLRRNAARGGRLDTESASQYVDDILFNKKQKYTINKMGVFESVKEVPQLLDMIQGQGIVELNSPSGGRIDVVRDTLFNEFAYVHGLCKSVAAKKNKRLYLMSNDVIRKLSGRFIFINPFDVNKFSDSCNFTRDSLFPISASLIPEIKSYILQNKLQLIGIPDDIQNNSTKDKHQN